MDGDLIRSRLAKVNREIEELCSDIDRAKKVKVLAVTKRKSAGEIKKALAAGQKVFGENYVDEWIEKAASLKSQSPCWHFIGQIQSKKAKLVAGKVELIHSVDRFKLALELNKRLEVLDAHQDILIQVNIAGEKQKGGVSVNDGPALIEEINNLSRLRIRGLMGMPPLSEEESQSRHYFSQIRNLQDKWKPYLDSRHNLVELSMGTSGDYLWAIKEGSTIVRLGTALFGER